MVTLAMVGFTMRPPGLILERFIRTGGWFEAFWLAFYAGFLVDILMKPELSKKWRHRLWSLFSFIFFLQLILGLIGYKRFLLTGRLHLPIPALIVSGPIYRSGGYAMLKLFLFTILFTGPAWCSWLCYIGAWDSACSRLKKRPDKLPKWIGYIRIALLFAVILSAYLLNRYGVDGITSAYIAGAFGIVGVIVMLTWSRKSGVMTHCTAYCPIGFVATMLGKANPFRIKIGNECNECGKCSVECRYNALLNEDIMQRKPGSSCTLCGDCIASCKEGHIHYKFFTLSGKKARALFVILIVSFHAVFLGIARL
jgi:polyferredoxin